MPARCGACAESAARRGPAAAAWGAPAATTARRRGRCRRSPRRRDSLAVLAREIPVAVGWDRVPVRGASVPIRGVPFAANAAGGVRERSTGATATEGDDLSQDADGHLLGGRGADIE